MDDKFATGRPSRPSKQGLSASWHPSIGSIAMVEPFAKGSGTMNLFELIPNRRPAESAEDEPELWPELGHGFELNQFYKHFSGAKGWLGEGYRVTSHGYYENADGLRQFRPPSAKPTRKFATKGIQANFEQRSTPSVAWGANGYVNVSP